MRSLRCASVCFFVLLLTLLSSIFCLAQSAPNLVTQPVNNTVRTVLSGNVHPLARPAYDRGEVPASMALHRMLLVLKRSDQQETALRHLIENQQNKKSSLYHQWVTPQQFGQQFGPSDSDIAAVTNWLTTNGFAVDKISNGRTVIEFDGTAGLVKQVFGTALHRYVINGEEHIANSTNPSIPTALAPVVVGVRSLHNFVSKPHNVLVGKYDAKTRQLTPAGKNPSFTVTSGNSTYYALGPYDFATIYDEPWATNPTATNGSGVTIAIVGRTDINPTDAPTFWSMFGFGQTGFAPMPTLNIITNGPDPGFTGDEAEADIDTQWSGAVAPGATIDYVTSETTETSDGVDLSALYIVDNNLAPVMSESYGNCEASLGTSGMSFYGAVWEQAAAQGISAMVSTGDNGSAGCDDPDTEAEAINGGNVNGIASTPWNAAIGGTDFNQPTQADINTYWNASNAPTTQQSAKSYIPELVWNDSCANPLLQLLTGGTTNPLTNCNNSSFSDFIDITAGSGGFSGSGLAQAFWSKPAWQTGTGVPNDNARDLPDVSLFASNGFLGSFYVICQSDQTGNVCNLNNFLGYGGTSVASPAFAGIMALVNQQYNGAQGVPGLVLYNLASKVPTAFHDLNTVSGTSSSSTNAVPCAPGSTSDCNSNSGQAYGVLYSGSAPEFSTTAGYDLASGLGSVDVNVLLANWNQVTFTGTTTSLTLNNNSSGPIVHGQPVAVSVTVNHQTGSTTPTGDVAIMVAPKPGTPGIDWNSLPNGSNAIGWNTNLLPGGTYSVIAHYGGDTTYGGSYSIPSQAITITPENSSVLLPGVQIYNSASQTWSPGTTVTYGTGATVAYLLRADVGNSQNPTQYCTSSNIACPTGTITFTDNGNPILDAPNGIFKLNSLGYTEDQNIQLPGGSNTVVATYSGDASYHTSSASVGITVIPAATTLNSVAVAPTAVVSGGNFTVTATVTTQSFGAAPTGTIAFLANGTALPGTVSYTPTAGNPASSSGTASLAASLTSSLATNGTYNITATYTTGDGNYSSQGSSNTAQLVVAQGVPMTAPPAPPSANPGQTTSTMFTASTSDGNVFAAAVTFTCSGLPTGASCAFSPSIAAGASNNQQVTVTVTTAGPFSGSAGQAVPVSHPLMRKRAANQRQRLWLPVGLPLAGIMLVGFTGRRMKRGYKIAGIALMLLLAAFLVACGGSSSPAPVVTVSPPTATLWPSGLGSGEAAQTQQFSASVTNTSNTAVTWTATAGTIDSTGLFTAPTTVPGGPVLITATSAANSSATGSASVTIHEPSPAGTYPVTITSAEGSGPQQVTTFSLTVN